MNGLVVGWWGSMKMRCVRITYCTDHEKVKKFTRPEIQALPVSEPCTDTQGLRSGLVVERIRLWHVAGGYNMVRFSTGSRHAISA